MFDLRLFEIHWKAEFAGRRFVAQDEVELTGTWHEQSDIFRIVATSQRQADAFFFDAFQYSGCQKLEIVNRIEHKLNGVIFSMRH